MIIFYLTLLIGGCVGCYYISEIKKTHSKQGFSWFMADMAFFNAALLGFLGTISEIIKIF